jgi:hypothetical protein
MQELIELAGINPVGLAQEIEDKVPDIVAPVKAAATAGGAILYSVLIESQIGKSKMGDRAILLGGSAVHGIASYFNWQMNLNPNVSDGLRIAGGMVGTIAALVGLGLFIATFVDQPFKGAEGKVLPKATQAAIRRLSI